MLSRRNTWLLLAIPIAIILLWASQRSNTNPENTSISYPNLSGHLLYLAPANGPAELFALDLATQQSIPLTDEAQITAFHISKDGLNIYYAATNQQNGANIWQLQIANRAQSLLIDCAAATCDNPQASPDGRFLAYSRLASASLYPQIWLYSFESGLESQISLIGQSALNPQWALDGRLIYYNFSTAAYESVLPGREARFRTPNALGDLLTWQPDSGAFVAAEAFTSTSDILRGTSGEASLQTPDPESQSALEITVTALLIYSENNSQSLIDYGDDLLEDAAPRFSPDGQWLAFTRKYLDEARWTPGRQLWLLNLASGETIALTDAPNYQIAATAWNAASTQIAFVRSNRTQFNQPLELWVMQRDASAAQLLLINAYAPQWLP